MTGFHRHTAVLPILAGALLAGCGSSNNTTTATTKPSAAVSSSAAATPTATASASPAGNIALTVALAPADVPSGIPGLVQSSDGLLGGTPNSDARVFTSPDSTTGIEIDLAAYPDSSKAAIDYPAFSSNAGKQVTTPSATSQPSIGAQANEYVGTNSTGKKIVSVAFQQGSVIGVVTMVSTNAVDTTVVEAIANAQASKINNAGL